MVEEVKEWSELQIGKTIPKINFYEIFEKFRESLVKEVEIESAISSYLSLKREDLDSEEEEKEII